MLGQQYLCSKGRAEISIVRPHQFYRVLANAFQQFVVRRAASALVDNACSAANPIGHNQTTCLSRADAEDRSRCLSAPPGQNFRKNLYALQLVSTHRQKSQSPPPPTVGRVGWTFQLCRNRTLLLCAYIIYYHDVALSDLKQPASNRTKASVTSSLLTIRHRR